MNVNFKLTGEKQIRAVLQGLPKPLEHRVLQAAYAEAAKPLVNEEHKLSPVGKTGKLADSHGTQKPAMKRVAEVGTILVGPRRGKYGGSFAHIVNNGTSERKHKNGKSVGSVKGTHYLERAFNNTKGMLMKNIEVLIGQKLLGFMKRTIKRHGS